MKKSRLIALFMDMIMALSLFAACGKTETPPAADPGTAAPSTPSTPSTGTTTPSAGTAMNAKGVITGAGSGLNVRTGPASSYSAIASLSNGSEVKILEDTGTGWYKISFNGIGGRATEGYASKNYIVVK